MCSLPFVPFALLPCPLLLSPLTLPSCLSTCTLPCCALLPHVLCLACHIQPFRLPFAWPSSQCRLQQHILLYKSTSPLEHELPCNLCVTMHMTSAVEHLGQQSLDMTVATVLLLLLCRGIERLEEQQQQHQKAMHQQLACQKQMYIDEMAKIRKNGCCISPPNTPSRSPLGSSHPGETPQLQLQSHGPDTHRQELPNHLPQQAQVQHMGKVQASSELNTPSKTMARK